MARAVVRLQQVFPATDGIQMDPALGVGERVAHGSGQARLRSAALLGVPEGIGQELLGTQAHADARGRGAVGIGEAGGNGHGLGTASALGDGGLAGRAVDAPGNSR
jgi:hypothetical protein